MTKIEWTHTYDTDGNVVAKGETWNPLAGCSPVSEGCRNCYAAKEAIRLAGNPNVKIAAKYAGTAEMRGAGKYRRAVFTGRVNLDEAALDAPLHWRKPRRIFVNSMSDLFHEAVPFEFIDRVFAVMALAPRHTFQVLTKRPERMAAYFNDDFPGRELAILSATAEFVGIGAPWQGKGLTAHLRDRSYFLALPNVWLGTSVEDQAAADERIPHLLRTPAAIRFLSCEPLLGPVDLLRTPRPGHHHDWLTGEYEDSRTKTSTPRIHWLIVGGESGPGARPCDVEWIRGLVRQCRDAGVACFVKQLGARPIAGEHLLERWAPHVKYAADHETVRLSDRKGGDWSEWPEDLRVRQFPARAGA